MTIENPEMNTAFHRNDLPDDFVHGQSVAIDTETMGLDNRRDRLCLVQLSIGDGTACLVKIDHGQDSAPNLVRLLRNRSVLKIFHFARFDIAALLAAFGALTEPVYCTKVASKLARTYTDQHGLKALAREVLDLDLNKEQQSTDWGSNTLSAAQIEYAANDVLHLHKIKIELDRMLEREGRMDLANACFDFLPVRANLDVAGWAGKDIFAH